MLVTQAIVVFALDLVRDAERALVTEVGAAGTAPVLAFLSDRPLAWDAVTHAPVTLFV
jgi:hypothetical protein